MTTYEQFKNEWTQPNHNKVDFDHVFKYQCVDLPLQFMYEMGVAMAGISGNAIDYAEKPTAAFLNAVTKVTDGSKQAGDILVFRGVSDPDGHIALRDTDVDKMLEQNAADGNGSGLGRDAIGVYRNIPYDRLVATYRLKVLVAAPAAAAPVPTSAEGTFNVTRDLPGYTTSTNAANRTNLVSTVHPGNYHIFNQAHGMVDVTSVAGVPGSWINPADNVAPAAAPTANYDGNAVTIEPGWGISNAAQAAGYPDASSPIRWASIAKLNGSDDWQTFNASLKPGQRITVGSYSAPAAAAAAPAAPAKPANITFTKLDVPLDLITKPNPTHVWQLDFANDTQAQSAYDLPGGAPFKAYGKAQRTDGDRPAYFMLQEDFGDADVSGVPANNRGVNTVDLATAPTPVVATVVPEPVAAPAANAAPEEGEKVDVKILPPNLDIKYQYTAFLSPQDYTAVKLDQHITELQGLHNADGSPVYPDQQLVPTQPVKVAGVMGPNREYYRTVKSVENGTYYAIPKEDLSRPDDISDNELAIIKKEAAEFEAAIAEQSRKIVKATANVDGFFARLFHRNKK